MSDHPVKYTLYPLTLYHPVLGAVTVDNQDDALRVFVPARDWFHTAEEADAHRTDREAMMVIHNTRRMEVDQMAGGDVHKDVAPDTGTVVHSVQHTENWVKPMLEEAKKTDDDKLAENEAAEQAARDRHADDADVEHVVIEPSTTTAISG